ncbi:polysaccharide deacetylase family protein [Frankia sp. ACN1ag]|uniref:polysaccharide deacetylase family protein n=1 Tax=Frankia sp. ACN1ag TaxID=102891 RepID=UPI001F209F1E|nr:polysaccharide deacetylase family protein [Frankia sp. ACN1ag]
MLLSLLSIGAAQALLGCSADSAPQGAATHDPGTASTTPTAPTTPTASTTSTAPATSTAPTAAVPGADEGPLPLSAPIPSPHPGPPVVVSHAPGRTRRIALTIDDGYDATTVAGYVAFAQRSKIPITFSPNGAYRAIWDRHAEALRPLVETGQLQIGNHTWTHKNLLHETDAAIRADIEKNEQWIQQTFGITSRPWFRPPYGAHNHHVDGLAGELGYTRILLWDGSFGDSTLLTPQQLIGLAQQYLQPGTIMLGHANHQTILGLFDQIEQLIEQRQLEPVTLDTMFGTSRAVG